jgi:hypothetical protein
LGRESLKHSGDGHPRFPSALEIVHDIVQPADQRLDIRPRPPHRFVGDRESVGVNRLLADVVAERNQFRPNLLMLACLIAVVKAKHISEIGWFEDRR